MKPITVKIQMRLPIRGRDLEKLEDGGASLVAQMVFGDKSVDFAERSIELGPADKAGLRLVRIEVSILPSQIMPLDFRSNHP